MHDWLLTWCRDIKHKYAYACKNVRQEYEALERDAASKIVRVPVPAAPGSAPTSAEAQYIEVTHETFSAPQIFFDPASAKLDVPPLQQLIDDAVQGCSIDSRRQLYGNIYLSVRPRSCRRCTCERCASGRAHHATGRRCCFQQS